MHLTNMDSSSKTNNTIDGPESGSSISDFRRSLPQFLAVAVKNMVLLGYGMTLGFPTIVIPAIKANQGNPNQEFSLSDEQISWFGSINLLCVPLGCLMSGMLTEATGRRRAMQIIKVPMFLSWMLFYYSTNIYHLYAGLILFGLSGGLMESAVFTYVAEVVEPRFRGMLTASGPTTVATGVLFEFIMGAFLNWRTVAWLSSILPCFTIIALCFVPESPYWLINKGRIDDARKSLARLRGWVSVDDIAIEFNAINDGFIRRKKDSDAVVIKSMAHRVLPYTKRSFVAPFTLISFTILVSNFSGLTTLQTYAVQIFKSLKSPIDEYYATIFYGMAQLTGALICVFSVRYTGKRPLAFVSLIGSGICSLITATYASIYIDSSPESKHSVDILEIGSKISNVSRSFNSVNDPIDNCEFHWLPVTFILLSAVLAHSGFRLIPWMMIGEVFPPDVRSSASGFVGGTGYFFAFLSNKIFLSMIAIMTLPGTFWFNSAVSLIGCAILYFTMPETEGKTLLEIESFFRRKPTSNAKRRNSVDQEVA